MYPVIKVTALSASGPLTSMNRLSVLAADFESTVNYILGHANFRKIAIFKFITVIRYGDIYVYPC